MILKRDENSEVVVGGVDTDGAIKPLLVDPVTGRLLIDIEVVSEPISPILNKNKIDENRESTSQGVGDDSTADEIPFHIDSRNGNLFLDVIVE